MKKAIHELEVNLKNIKFQMQFVYRFLYLCSFMHCIWCKDNSTKNPIVAMQFKGRSGIKNSPMNYDL